MVGYLHAGWNAFVVAAFTEELFKFLFVMILIWRSKHFNEQFDGIVYAVYVSMGFAMVENVLYVLDGGLSTALVRAFTAVPAHAIFAVSMGYFLGRAKFNKTRRVTFLFAAIGMPILLHGLYDFILMSEMPMFLLFFLVYMVVLYRYGLRSMRTLSDDSRFNPKSTRYHRNTDTTFSVEDPFANNPPSPEPASQEPESEQTNERGFDV
jgi:RsiW-degrading membrane proteinase PrsW (M82 family)